VLELGIDASPQRVQEVARRLGLSLVVSERFNALRRAIYRFQFFDKNGIIAGGQPNYVYQVTQDANPQASPASAGSEAAPVEGGLQASPQEPASYTLPTTGDPAQYVISKLRLDEVHGRVQGKDVLVALIDSEIDRRHPDLQSAIVERFDAGCGADRPDSHGTGMAGAIASRSYLRGIAPQTRILAICAFGGKSATAESTTMQIIRGIDYAVERGARVVNMSFTGPRDPTLERALRTAHDKGAALIAATGNKDPQVAAALSWRRPWSDRGHRHRRARQRLCRSQPRQLHCGCGARRRCDGAVAGQRVRLIDWHFGCRRECQRGRSAADGDQAEARSGDASLSAGDHRKDIECAQPRRSRFRAGRSGSRARREPAAGRAAAARGKHGEVRSAGPAHPLNLSWNALRDSPLAAKFQIAGHPAFPLCLCLVAGSAKASPWLAPIVGKRQSGSIGPGDRHTMYAWPASSVVVLPLEIAE